MNSNLDTNSISDTIVTSVKMADYKKLFLSITNSSSISLYNYNYDFTSSNENLIIGYLSAFEKFLSQIFNVDIYKPYKMMKFEDKKIVVMRVDAIIIYHAFEGDINMANDYLYLFVELVMKSKAWDNLTRMRPKIENTEIKELDLIIENVLPNNTHL